MSLIVNNVATFWSVNGGLIIPPFAKSTGRMLCNKLIIPVTNRVINNKGSKLVIHFRLDFFSRDLCLKSKLYLILKAILFLLMPSLFNNIFNIYNMHKISIKYIILMNSKYDPIVPIKIPNVTPIASALLARE